MNGHPGAPRAYYGLTILSLINLVNYVDRFIVFGIVLQIEKEFAPEHPNGGLLTTAFILVYMVASPLGGYLGDRIQRRYLVAASILAWSVTTVLAGFAGSFVVLVLARALTGIGEAGYGSVAPAIISDLFPKEKRSRMLAYFYLAIPVGAAIAFVAGSWIGEHVSWRAAFFIVGAPGALLSLLALKMPEPARGATEAHAGPAEIPLGEALRTLRHNSLYWLTTAGYTLMTFTLGGVGAWMAAFLQEERGLTQSQAGGYLGPITALAGAAGTLLGGFMGDRADRRQKNGGLRLSGWGLIVAGPFLYAAVNIGGAPLGGWLLAGALAMIFLVQVLIWLNTGPINATLVNSVPPALRARAFGLNTLIIHALGDALSPWLMGVVRSVSSYQFAIELTAIPVVVGGVLLIFAAARGREALAGVDVARLASSPGDDHAGAA